jgi:hypothetical protein
MRLPAEAPSFHRHDAAREQKRDFIVIASHRRRRPAGLLLGRETNKALILTKTPPLVCR